MKKLVTFLVVVVAFLGGFSQSVRGQECKKITIQPLHHDSSFLYLKQSQIDYICFYAEYLINKADLPFDIITQVYQLKKIEPISVFGKYDFSGFHGSGALSGYFYSQSNYDSTVVYPLCFSHMKKYPFYLPSSISTKTLCAKFTSIYSKYGQNPIVLFMNDSFSLKFYGMVLARNILLTFGANTRNTTTGHLLSENVWQMGDSILPSTIEIIKSNLTMDCLSTVVGCTTRVPVSINQIEHTRDDIKIINKLIVNDNHNLIIIYSIDGRELVKTKKSSINLDELPNGILIIQSEKKRPIKIINFL